MKTAVLHLVREPGASAAFLRSYYEHLSGADHELFLVLKGRVRAPQPGFSEIRVSDFGRSLHAFGKVIRSAALGAEFDTVCVLNSFSRVQAHDWLARLVVAARRPEVGAAGCTASLESFLGNKPSLARALAFPPWPNPHLRTNALVMRMDIARRFWPRFAWNKPLEHVAESGWWGLTNRLRCSGLDAVAVNAVSECALKAGWDSLSAPCFHPQWQPLVADNRCGGGGA